MFSISIIAIPLTININFHSNDNIPTENQKKNNNLTEKSSPENEKNEEIYTNNILNLNDLNKKFNYFKTFDITNRKTSIESLKSKYNKAKDEEDIKLFLEVFNESLIIIFNEHQENNLDHEPYLKLILSARQLIDNNYKINNNDNLNELTLYFCENILNSLNKFKNIEKTFFKEYIIYAKIQTEFEIAGNYLEKITTNKKNNISTDIIIDTDIAEKHFKNVINEINNLNGYKNEYTILYKLRSYYGIYLLTNNKKYLLEAKKFYTEEQNHINEKHKPECQELMQTINTLIK